MMTLTPLSERLFLATWTDLYPFETNSLVYHGFEINLMIDTFLGPSPMNQLLKALPVPTAPCPYIIVNTHYHFDHVWGNSSFPSSMRIATSLCYQWMKQHFAEEREKNAPYWEPGNQLCLPNCLIDTPLFFPEEGIEIFPSPGHTEDGCSVLFQKDSVLAVGDNLEKPIPYLENQRWSPYLDTLQRYAGCKVKTIIAGHGKVDQNDIETTQRYILAWQKNQTFEYEREPFLQRHQQNKSTLSSSQGDGVVG